jgi:rhodanese-related sulfurtransferase/DNA-binding transcriptional ArsR family regulator
LNSRSKPDSDTRALKNLAYKHIARLGKALSSGPRLEILDLLTQGPRTVESIAAEVGQSVANASHHLRTLAKAGLVRSERDGLFVTYRVADEDTATLYAQLRSSAERRYRDLRDTAEELLKDRESEAIDALALAARIRAGDVTIVDVRPASEYEAGHLPGAISIPLGELERRACELPADRRVVAYCRGPLCVMAVSAAASLAERGIRTAHFDRSVADWQAMGLPVERGKEGAR